MFKNAIIKIAATDEAYETCLLKAITKDNLSVKRFVVVNARSANHALLAQKTTYSTALDSGLLHDRRKVRITDSYRIVSKRNTLVATSTDAANIYALELQNMNRNIENNENQ